MFAKLKDAWKLLTIKWQAWFAAFVSVWLLIPETQKQSVLEMLPGLGGKGPGLLVLMGIAVTVYMRMKPQPGVATTLYAAPKPEAPPAWMQPLPPHEDASDD